LSSYSDRSMSEAADFLRLLRQGPVNHQEAARLYGPYALAAYKRLLASQGHLIQTRYPMDGTVYTLVKDADDDLRLEGTA